MASLVRLAQRLLLCLTALWVVAIISGACGTYPTAYAVYVMSRCSSYRNYAVPISSSSSSIVGVLLVDMANLHGASTTHKLHMRLWRMRHTDNEAPRDEHFSIHRFAKLDVQPARRLLKDNTEGVGEGTESVGEGTGYLSSTHGGSKDSTTAASRL